MKLIFPTMFVLVTFCGLARANLTCYDCLYYSKRQYYVDECQSLVQPRDNLLLTCKTEDIYCKVERRRTHGIVIRLERSCAKECQYGCRWQGVGMTFETCTWCCNKPACNTGNGANSVETVVFEGKVTKYLSLVLVLLLCTTI